MRANRGLWFLLTGDDRDVGLTVTLRRGEMRNVLVAEAQVDGQRSVCDLRFRDRGRYLTLQARNELKMMQVPGFVFHGSDRVSIGASDGKLLARLATSGTIYLAMLPLASGGGPFENLRFERTSKGEQVSGEEPASRSELKEAGEPPR